MCIRDSPCVVAPVAREHDGLRVAHTTVAGFPDEAALQRGVVARAVDTAQTGRSPGGASHGRDDARAGRDALLAVPVAQDGKVLGAVVVARPAPAFGTADAETLGRLAPFVAAALSAAERHRDVSEQVLVDPLTTVGNRRRLQRDLPGLLADGRRVAMAMVDVDHFKRYNDAHRGL